MFTPFERRLVWVVEKHHRTNTPIAFPHFEGRLTTIIFIINADNADQLKRVQDGYFSKQGEPAVRARSLGRYAAQGLSLDYPRQFETALLKLTPEDVRAAAERWFTYSCQVILGPPLAPSGDVKQ